MGFKTQRRFVYSPVKEKKSDASTPTKLKSKKRDWRYISNDQKKIFLKDSFPSTVDARVTGWILQEH